MTSGDGQPDSGGASDSAADYLLRDDPIESFADDDFGHKQYVETLSDIIRKVDPPWQIALYGRWGTGKSSILEMIGQNLEEGGSPDGSSFDSIEFVEFDAWKHAEDSVRTEFLLTLDDQLGGDEGVLGEERITDELYDVTVSEESVEFEAPSEFKLIPVIGTDSVWSKLVSAGRQIKSDWILLIPIILVTIIAITEHFRPGLIPLGSSGISSLITAALLPILIYLLRELAGAEATYKRMLNPRKDWSGAYSGLFEEILDTHGNSTEDSTEDIKYAIAIDNLDRCEPEVVYDVLISMKTFFEDGPDGNSRCVYIVPCDKRTLQRHIGSVTDMDTSPESEDDPLGDEDEFLRKFFQTTIQLPPIEVQDIEAYATAQFESLQESRRPDDEEGVVDVLTNYDIQTPRRIKHTINRFLSLYELAEKLEEAKQLEYRAVTDNEPFLMKVLIIQEEFPEVYKHIRGDPSLFTAFQEVAMETEIGDEPNKSRPAMASDGGIVESDSTLGKQTHGPTLSNAEIQQALRANPRLHRFLKQTDSYRTDPEPYIYLSDAEYGDLLGRYKGFREALRNGDQGNAKDELHSIPDIESNEVERVVKDIIRREISAYGDDSEQSTSIRQNGNISDSDGESDSTELVSGESSVVGTLFELLGTDSEQRIGGLAEGIEPAFNNRAIVDKLFVDDTEVVFDEVGVWRALVAQESSEDLSQLTTEAIEFATSQGISDSTTRKNYLRAIFSTLPYNTNGDLVSRISSTLRTNIDNQLLDEPSGEYMRTLGVEISNQPDVIQQVATVSLTKSLTDVLGETAQPNHGSELIETLFAFEEHLHQIDRFTEADRRTFINKLLKNIAKFDYDTGSDVGFDALKRLQDVNLTLVSTATGLAIQRRIRSRLNDDLDTNFDLVDSWLNIYDSVTGYGPFSEDEIPNLSWATLTSEETIDKRNETEETLKRILEGDEAQLEQFTRRVIDWDIDVFKRHAIFKNYLDTAPETYLSVDDVGEVLTTIGEGELTPLEEYISELVTEHSNRIVFWAGVALKQPSKFEGIQSDLAQECIDQTATSEPEDWSHLLSYPASVYDELEDEPTLQRRLTDRIKKTLVTGDQPRQRAAAEAIQRLPADVRQSLFSRAFSLIKREYKSGNTPAPALERFILSECSTDKQASIHEARREFVQRDANDAEYLDAQKAALDFVIKSAQNGCEFVERETLRELYHALEDRYQYLQFSRFNEEVTQIQSLLEGEQELTNNKATPVEDTAIEGESQ